MPILIGALLAIPFVVMINKCDQNLNKARDQRQEAFIKKQSIICKKVYPQLTFDECQEILRR